MSEDNGKKSNGQGPEGKKTFLSAEEILALDDLDITPHWVPEWKTWVRFRTLPADVSLKFQNDLEDPARKNGGWITIFAMSAVDEDGHRMFSQQQLEALRKKNTRVFMRMLDILLELNGLTKDSHKALKNDLSEEGTDDSRAASREN